MRSGTSSTSKLSKWLLLALVLTFAPAALASTTRYVDGVNGNDSNDCLSSQTACKTIGQAISLCSSGDTIMVAPAIYTENLTIGINLKIIGSDAATTIVDGNQAGSVFTISNTAAHVRLTKLTIRNGSEPQNGGGIINSGILTINQSIVTGNVTTVYPSDGGGISNSGTLTINKSTITANKATRFGGGIYNYNKGALMINNSSISGNSASFDAGGGIASEFEATLTINNSTVSGNGAYYGGGISSDSRLTINNSTVSGNSAYYGGGILSDSNPVTINNSTISGNSANYANKGGGILSGNNPVTLQNSIVANNSGGNCFETFNLISNGYNLSSDDTCNLSNTGDLNNTDPKLGKLNNNGGPTQTIRLLKSSPAIDAGNPNGCTDDKGNLLKTDQRGWARPGKRSNRCDIGAFERQID